MMREPEYVLQKAQTRYRSKWRDALLGTEPGTYTVALDPPSASAITARAAEVSACWSAGGNGPHRTPALPCAKTPSAPSSATSRSTPTSISRTPTR